MNMDKPRECNNYETFGVCVNGSACRYSHDVQPFFTRKAFFTVALDNPQISGSVGFHPMEGDSISRKIYYIPKNNEWYNMGAVQGDKVELQISEKRHKERLHFARITTILLQVNSIQRQIGGITCFAHVTYGDCRFGLRCCMVHRVDAVLEQHFHVAKVLSEPTSSPRSGYELHVSQLNEDGEIVEKNYYLPDCGEWFSMNAAEGNLIIVQESERTMLQQNRELSHYGRVAAILHKTQSINEVVIPLERSINRGFVIEQQGKYLRCFANSLGKCLYSKDCKRIGIHIAAAALQSGLEKLDHHFVPFHRADAKERPTTVFDVNMTRLALSVYRHSLCGTVEGPMITPLLIPSEKIFTFKDGRHHSNKSDHYFHTLWTVFGTCSLMEDVAKSPIASFMVDFPDTWKERYLIHQMKIFFSKQLMVFLQSKDERFVITKNILSKNSLPKEEIVVPASTVDNVKSAWKLSDDEKSISLAFLLGSAKRGVSAFWDDHFGNYWYRKDIVSCKQVPDSKIVISTLPAWQTSDFVNQQIVLAMVISPQITLYSKSEISGIIAIRQRTPTILRTVVRKLSDITVNLQFCGKYGRKNGNREMILQNLFPGQIFISTEPSSNTDKEHADLVESVNSISILLKELTCQEYCNTVMVRLSGEKLSALTDTATDLGIDANETKQTIADLITAEYDKPSPYESQGQDTKITLRRGVELQLQVSMEEESDKKVSDRIRLLKIGNNCHLCLIHLNSPRSAFGSLHTDIITENTLSEMKKQIDENRLEFQVLQGIGIDWQDDYFSSGWFSTPSCITPGNLLCIRKEIIGSQTQGPFVWTCHGVVSEVSGTDVKFLVCSLHQDQTPDMWREGDNQFLVEVIHVSAEPC